VKWFQHDANASHDAKIKKLILRHGVDGYGIYFHCLELISGDLTQTNITFELEHDSEIIADNLKIKGDEQMSGIDKVNMILKTFIELGLFEENNNRIFCFKLASRLDNTISRSAEINKIKKIRSDNVEATQTYKAEDNTIHNNTIKENRADNNKIVCDAKTDDQFDEFWNLYDKKTNMAKCKKKYLKLSQTNRDKIRETLPSYISSTPDKQYRKNPETYLNNHSWNDEIITSSGNKPTFTPINPKTIDYSQNKL